MATTINASTSSGLVSTADTSGVLQLQTANTTALTLSAAQAATFAGTAQFPTTIGVGNATPSASGAGVSFPATQSASSDANTLDDYEEGTWTPTQGSALTSVTGTFTASGNYTKVGRLVTVNFTASATSFTYTTGTGSVVGSMPFTVGAFNSYGSGVNAAGSVNLPFYGLGTVNAVYSTVSFTTSSVSGTITFFV
jgi:hypothetical protein